MVFEADQRDHSVVFHPGAFRSAIALQEPKIQQESKNIIGHRRHLLYILFDFCIGGNCERTL